MKRRITLSKLHGKDGKPIRITVPARMTAAGLRSFRAAARRSGREMRALLSS